MHYVGTIDCFQAGIRPYKEDATWYLPPVTQDTTIKPLQLYHVAGLFGFLMIGVGLGIVVFIIELCMKKIKSL